MKKFKTSDRLKQLMKEQKLKQVDILNLCKPYCDKYNVKLAKNDLSQYVSGKVQPGSDKLSILGMALGVSETWLMGYDVPRVTSSAFSSKLPDNIIAFPKMKKIPLLGTIACGEPILAEENIDAYISVDENSDAAFALKCKGDSMITARIFDGDVVYIRPQPDVENGEIAAVLIDNEATLKKVYKAKNKLTLSPCNPMYEDMVYTDEQLNQIKILGKAVAFTSVIRNS